MSKRNFVTEGKACGLSGDELLKYIEEKEKLERDERENELTIQLELQKIQLETQKAREHEVNLLLELKKMEVERGEETPPVENQVSTSSSGFRRDIQKPESLDLSSISMKHFKSWLGAWNDYCMLINFDSLDIQMKNALFRSILTTQSRSILQYAIGLSNDEFDVPNALKQIEKYVRSKRNILLDRVAFDERKQKEGETFDEFLISVKELGDEADLCSTCIDDRIAAKLTSGIADNETRRKLLAISPTPCLSNVIDICRSEEIAKTSDRCLSQSSDLDIICRIKRDNNSKIKEQSSYSSKKDCWRCGRKDCDPIKCPALTSPCNSCQKTGHWEVKCKTKKKEVRGFTVVNVSRFSRKRNFGKKVPTLTVSVTQIAGMMKLGEVTAIPDTGAEASIAGPEVMKRMKIPIENVIPLPEEIIVAANGTAFDIIGYVPVQFQIGDRISIENLIFCKQQKGTILSWSVCKDLGIIPENFPTQIKNSETEKNSKHTVNQRTIVNRNVQRVTISENPTLEERKNIRSQLLEEFHDVFDCHQELKTMEGEPMKIHLSDEAQPFSVHTPRSIPYAWREQVKTEIDDMIQKGIIKKIDEPTEWCHPLVVVQKSKGGIRICVDLTKLNKFVKRPIHPLKTPREAVSNIPLGCKYFTTFDAKSGYWQIPLDEESQKLTTFVTPWGRYCFTRGPMGLSSTGDEYCRRGDEIFRTLDIQKVMDDLISYDTSFKKHYGNVRKILEMCRIHRLTMNPDKFHFAQPETDFCGYIVGQKGFTVDEKKIEALRNFPQPENITQLRSFLGLVNQFADFSSKISKHASTLRTLLSTKNDYTWTTNHEESFNELKQLLTSPPILKQFDPTLETDLQTDASRIHGLGFALLQKHNDRWHLVQCGSRVLSSAESRYAMVELELLAVTWALQKCRLYLLGLPFFKISVDHKPLIPILNQKTLDEIENQRLQRLKEKTMSFNFEAIWIQGLDHKIPDALSRSPVEIYKDEDETDLKINIRSIWKILNSHLNDPLLEELKREALLDDNYKDLLEQIQDGFPDGKENMTPYVKQFFRMRDELTTEDGLVLLGTRIVIPKMSQKRVLERLHDAHQGVENTKRRARQTVYWCGINNDISNMINQCDQCQNRRPSQQKETLLLENCPSRPFEDVSADFFSYGGKDYLLYTDRLSNWSYVYFFERGNTKTNKVIHALRNLFVDMGVPLRIRTDGGPQFTSREFKDFLKRWGVEGVQSTPHYPQSNGHIESSVKEMKNLIAKTTKNGNLDDEAFSKGLLELRNTPRTSGLSPAEIVFGRQLRGTVPTHYSAFKNWKLTPEEMRKRCQSVHEKSKIEYDFNARDLQKLTIGTIVRVQHWKTKRWDTLGTIVAVGKHRDYLVKRVDGSVTWRNRRFLKKV